MTICLNLQKKKKKIAKILWAKIGNLLEYNGNQINNWA